MTAVMSGNCLLARAAAAWSRPALSVEAVTSTETKRNAAEVDEGADGVCVGGNLRHKTTRNETISNEESHETCPYCHRAKVRRTV